MRPFTWTSKIRRFALLAPKPVAEIPVLSVEARTAAQYDVLQKAALIRERRAINIR